MIRRSHLLRVPFWAALGLALFVGLLYYPLLFTNRVLAGGDILLYFYPYRDYAAALLRNGEIPLWNPYIFMGAPFLANPQAAVLYPLHWPLIWLPVTKQIYWSAALHTWLLGVGLYLFLRRCHLTVWASLAGGTVLAGCGFYGGLLGHINQLNAATWLPWTLLILDFQQTESKIKNQKSKVAWFALFVALMLLAGHTQTAYINLFGVGSWLVWSALYSLPDWRLSRANLRLLRSRLTPSLLVYGGGVVLGGLLCAAQLLPTVELNGLGLRQGGLSYGEATSFSLRPLQLLWTLLPTYGLRDLGQIFGVGYTEFVGYVGLLGLLLALVGAWQGRGPARQLGIFFAAIGLFLALGRWNPVYYLLYQLVPGFDLFRVPARWLMLYSVGMAVLAGLGVDWVSRRLGAQKLVIRTSTGSVIPSPSHLVTLSPSHLVTLSPPHLVTLSPPHLVTLSPPHLVILSFSLLLFLSLDLLLAAQALPHRQPTAPQALYEVRTAPAHLLTDPTREEVDPAAMGRFLGMSTITYDPGDMADWRRVMLEDDPPQLDARAFEQFIIGLKIQELIVPNLSLFWRIPAVDGFDGGVLPLQRYNQLLTLLIPPDQLVPDGRLREQIKSVPSADLLGLLNVQYVITDKVRDRWFEDVFYDRQLGARLTADRPMLDVEAPRAFAATHIDLIGYVEGDAAFLHDAQRPVLAVTPMTAQGMSAPLLITAGDQPGAGLADPGLNSPVAQQSGAIVAFQDVAQARQEYRVRLPLATPITPTALHLERLETPLTVVIQAITLFDARTKMFVPLLPSDRGRFRLVHSGDVKIYENLDVRPRAYLVHQVYAATNGDEALARVRDDITVQAGQAAVVEGALTLTATQTTSAAAIISHYAAEEVIVQTHSETEALLVLSDTAYPGWQATVDGAPSTIYTTNVLFRGVRVPAGEHEVRFVYQPISWQRGVMVSGMALLFWLGLMGMTIYDLALARATTFLA